MANWQTIAEAQPEFAKTARELLDAHKHKTMATLRRDGSPRISGIEATFRDGEVWLGMMAGSLKALDLLRDPRLALHSASDDPVGDPPTWPGDAKIAGRAVEVADPERLAEFANQPDQHFHLFRIDIAEVVLTRLGEPADHLRIEVWTEGGGYRRIERR